MDLNTDLLDASLDKVTSSTNDIAMNEAGMDSLAIETMQVARAANDYLNRIIAIVEDTKKYYKSESGDEFRRRFNEFKLNFPIVVQNIENYAYSLKKAKSNYQNLAEVSVMKLNQAALNVQDYIKKEGN